MKLTDFNIQQRIIACKSLLMKLTYNETIIAIFSTIHTTTLIHRTHNSYNYINNKPNFAVMITLLNVGICI